MAFGRVSPGKYRYGPRAKWAAKRTCALHRATCRLRELIDRIGEKRRIVLLPAVTCHLPQPHAH